MFLARRRFLQLAAGAAGSMLLASCATPRRSRRPGPNEKLHHAAIGVGGMMGGRDLDQFLSHPGCRVAALCDVDRSHLDAAAARVPGARLYADWREMLVREGDRIDSVSITVPDHMHAAIALAAVRAGKHVYCQKPLCHDVAECRALADAARHSGVVTQLGTQFASGLGDRQAVQWLRAGVVGRVSRVILCANRRGAERYRLAGPRPETGVAAPDGLAWDLWLGNAPARPYAPEVYHPSTWRSWQDFGTGWSGDIGCHLFDAVWKGLELTAPREVSARVQETWRNTTARRADTWPQTNHIVWIFPGNARTTSELTVEWYDGDRFPPDDVQALARAEGFKAYPGEAAMVIGSEGALLLPHQSGPRLLPRERFADVAREPFAPRNHYHHFVDGCFGTATPESPFLATAPMTEAILLGTVALRVPDTRLQWDAARMRIPNSSDAQQLLRRTYRSGWKVAGL